MFLLFPFMCFRLQFVIGCVCSLLLGAFFCFLCRLCNWRKSYCASILVYCTSTL